MCAPRPVVAVDVDGVINAVGEDATISHLIPLPEDAHPINPFFLGREAVAVALVPAAAEFFMAAADADLRWASAWEHLADAVGHLIGIGPLPLAVDSDRRPAHAGESEVEWKAASIRAAIAPDAPLVWVDDVADPALMADRAGPTLVIAPDPRVGLTFAHVRLVADFLQQHTAAHSRTHVATMGRTPSTNGVSA